MPYILIKRKVDGPSVPELGTPTAVTFDSVTVPLARPSTGPNAIASYVIERATSVAGPWTIAAEGPAIFGNPPAQFVDGGRLALTEYFYRARATDTAGRVSAYCAIVSAITAATVLPSTALRYPLLGMYWVGNDTSLGGLTVQYTTAAGIARMARCAYVVISRNPEWEAAGYPGTQAIAAAVKAASQVGTKVVSYTDTERVYKASTTTDYATRRAKIAAENWYLYDTGTSGTPLNSYFASDGFTINPTGFVPRDGQGRTATEWMADFEPSWMWGGAEGNAPSADLAGIFWDNVLKGPRINGDYNRDGVRDSSKSETVKAWYRAGIATGISRARSNFPTRLHTGNLAEFVVFNDDGNPDLLASEYAQLLDGGVIEHVIGNFFSIEAFESASGMVARLRKVHDVVRDPSMTGFHAYPDNSSRTNWQAFRHALACCLVATDFNFMWTRADGHQFWDWYDEYDFDLGPPLASSPRQVGATQSGIWRRDYTNGIALWAPKGVSGTINLGGTFYRLRGTQAPGVNNGAAVTSVTFGVNTIPYWSNQTVTSQSIAGRDGLILSRTPT